MRIYSLYNNRLSYFNKPFYAESDAEAKQYIINVICAGVDTSISNCINDLILFCIGDFTASLDLNSYNDSPIDTCFEDICLVSDLRQYLPEELIVYKQAQILKSISTLENCINDLTENVNVNDSAVKKTFDNLFSKNPKLRM